MSRGDLFDDITRILASPMPRRQAFRLIAGGLASGAVVSLLEPAQAQGNIPYNGICGEFMVVEGREFCEGPRDSCEEGLHCVHTDECRCCAVDVDCPHCCRPGETCNEAGNCCPNKNPNTKSKVELQSGGQAAKVTIQNTVEGISSITLTKAVNCTVPGVPVTGSAIKTPVILTVTKIDPTKRAQFEFDVVCALCHQLVDPIFTVLNLTTGRWVRQTFAGVPRAEHFITVTNGNPGLNRLHIWVNSKHYTTLKLADNETRSLDLAAAMTNTDNTISLVGAGELGASAAVAIGDTPPAQATNNAGMGATGVMQAQGSGHRHNAIWGPLAEETEENSHLHAANAASQTVQVNFNGALNSGAAANPSVFTVEETARRWPCKRRMPKRAPPVWT